MFSREEILRSPEYWFEDAQNELYRQVVEYKERKGINQTQLAEELGVTKGYVSQILKGEFNYTLKKLIEISLAIGQVPKIEYSSLEKIIEDDNKSQFLHLQTSQPFFITLPSTNQSFDQKGEVAEPDEIYSDTASKIA
jgi:transcriptional regulator with XRE-family HTH domain